MDAVCDNNINNDNNNNNSKKRGFTSRSKLSSSSTSYHSTAKKKSTIEKLMQIDYGQYWGNLCSGCNGDVLKNCLKTYFKNDLNILEAAAVEKYNHLKMLTKEEHTVIIDAHLRGLSTKKNNARSHTEYKIQFKPGIQIPCCKHCYMKFNHITKSKHWYY
jgi:hypothetical protein